MPLLQGIQSGVADADHGYQAMPPEQLYHTLGYEPWDTTPEATASDSAFVVQCGGIDRGMRFLLQCSVDCAV